MTYKSAQKMKQSFNMSYDLTSSFCSHSTSQACQPESVESPEPVNAPEDECSQ